MDALHHSHGFIRSPMADPHHPHHHHQQQHQPPPPGSWYSGQFQFHPSPPPPHHSAEPPHPHPHNQWLPHPDLPMPFSHPPPQLNYNHPNTAAYLPSHFAHPPRSFHPPPHLYPQMYPHPPDQTWGNPNWPRHHGWEYPDNNIPHSNEEDWAAKARAWAAANTARENQNTQLQFTSAGRMEEQNHVYQDHYQHSVEPRFADIQQSSLPPLSHEPLPISATDYHRPLANHLHESSSFSSGPPTYALDEPISYSAKDGPLAPDANPISVPRQGSILVRSSVYQQEVPSIYSSIPGIEEPSSRANDQAHMPLPPRSTVQGKIHAQHTLAAVTGSISVDQSHFVYGVQSVEAPVDASDLPLAFEHGSSLDHDTQQQTSYTHPEQPLPVGGVDQITAMSSIHAWTPPVAPGIAFPPIPPPAPSGPQFDPPFLPPHTLPGHSAPMFGKIPGPTVHPGIPPVTAPFGIGAGTALHPAAVFPGDANGSFNVSERPKKASVPNWLRDELMKTKAAVIASSLQDNRTGACFSSSGAEDADNFYKKSDRLVDTKSIDSTRSTEDDEDDEDDVEAARTAAINQEIKRVLTEVLLKVTDELFEEIASKVLDEDDLTIEVDHVSVPASQEVSPSPLSLLASKASAKVLVPAKVKDAKDEDVSGNSRSSSPGDVLGLANYASDDEEVESSSFLSAMQRDDASSQQLNGDSEVDVLIGRVDKGIPRTENEESSTVRKDVEADFSKGAKNEALQNHGTLDDVARNMTNQAFPTTNGELDDPVTGSALLAVKVGSSGINGDQVIVGVGNEQPLSQGYRNVVVPEQTAEEMAYEKPHASTDVENTMTDDSQDREGRKKSNKNQDKSKKSDPVSKNLGKDTEAGNAKADQKHSNSNDSRRRDDGDVGKEKTDERTRMRDRMKDREDKHGEKLRNSYSRKSSSHSNVKEDKKETVKVKRPSTKEDNDRKRERERDEKEDRSKHRDKRDSRRYKRRRSSSVSSRGRNSRDNLSGRLTSGSSDEASEDSRHRKLQSKRRSLSPSPVRSRRRQVSRSPHVKHSQRRHSPYSSLESRGRQSRSGSPMRRRR